MSVARPVRPRYTVGVLDVGVDESSFSVTISSAPVFLLVVVVEEDMFGVAEVEGALKEKILEKLLLIVRFCIPRRRSQAMATQFLPVMATQAPPSVR